MSKLSVYLVFHDWHEKRIKKMDTFGEKRERKTSELIEYRIIKCIID